MARTLKLTDLAPHLRQAVQAQIDQDAKDRRRRQDADRLAQEYVAGSLELWIPGEPPTATHQAKHIATRNGRPTLRDDANLVAARTWYAAAIGRNPDPAKLAAPLTAFLQFRWKSSEVVWYEEKPDADNAAKAVLDAIEKAGFIHDKHVTRLLVEKCRAKEPDGVYGPGVYIRLATLTQGPTINRAPTPHTRRIVPR